MWKLNHTLLNNQCIREEITREVRKYSEINENEKKTHTKKQNLAVLRRKFIATNAYITKKENSKKQGNSTT